MTGYQEVAKKRKTNVVDHEDWGVLEGKKKKKKRATESERDRKDKHRERLRVDVC